MQRLRHTTLFGAFCLAASVAACSDNVIPTDPGPGIIITQAPVLQTLVGTLELIDGRVWLRVGESVVQLMGAEAEVMRSLIGSEVAMTGTYDGVEAYIVQAFSVRSVGGQPAADGILAATDEGYGLLLADGTLRMIVDPPADLLAHVGARVWIAGPPDGPPVAFGVII